MDVNKKWVAERKTKSKGSFNIFILNVDDYL